LRSDIIFLASFLALAPIAAQGAATIVLQNMDPAGQGFNDPAPAAPVGGNTGTTIGQQRLIVFQAAADRWGATLTSSQTIVVPANWEALACTSSTGVLVSAGSIGMFRDFPGASKSGTWYPGALANKLSGADRDPGNADIRMRLNINLGKPGCLDGSSFYLGLDNNHGTAIDLVTVVIHELCHGLGFQTFTDGSSGAHNSGFPTIYDWFLLDTQSNLLWPNEDNAQRAASALRWGRLVWNGPNITNAVPQVLQLGISLLTVSAPGLVAGSYPVGTAAFGPPLSEPGVTAEVMPVVDTAPNTGLACTALSPLNAAAVNGKIALIDRGTCSFVSKVQACQAAGAVGVIIVNNLLGSPPPDLSGSDPSITIPTVSVTQSDGALLKSALVTRSRLHSGMLATLARHPSMRAGANSNGQALLFTPGIFQSGSSISHWDSTAFPNQLMEPAINSDLTHAVIPPQDLSFRLLQDIGW
jgi:hypothetical protein